MPPWKFILDVGEAGAMDKTPPKPTLNVGFVDGPSGVVWTSEPAIASGRDG